MRTFLHNSSRTERDTLSQLEALPFNALRLKCWILFAHSLPDWPRRTLEWSERHGLL